MKTIVIRTSYLQSDLEWVIFDEHQHSIISLTLSKVAPLPVLTDYEVIFLIPSKDILLTEVNLPPMSNAKLIKAIPFALQDMLIEDVNNLHFAIGKIQDGVTSVAIVNKRFTA